MPLAWISRDQNFLSTEAGHVKADEELAQLRDKQLGLAFDLVGCAHEDLASPLLRHSLAVYVRRCGDNPAVLAFPFGNYAGRLLHGEAITRKNWASLSFCFAFLSLAVSIFSAALPKGDSFEASLGNRPLGRNGLRFYHLRAESLACFLDGSVRLRELVSRSSSKGWAIAHTHHGKTHQKKRARRLKQPAVHWKRASPGPSRLSMALAVCLWMETDKTWLHIAAVLWPQVCSTADLASALFAAAVSREPTVGLQPPP